MDNLYRFVRGYSRVTVEGASPELFLNELTKRRIPFWDLIWMNGLCVQVSIYSKDRTQVQQSAEKAMCEFSNETTQGFLYHIRGLFVRPVLIGCMVISLLCTLWLSDHLLFFSVTGNNAIESEHILHVLEMIGVKFGMKGPDVTPKWIKDHVLNVIPELQWITVTQNGCKAEIVVRERPQTPEINERKGLANVIAAENGIILEQSIYAGQPIKAVGDVVQKGEMLVSGVVDLERTFSIEHARADIFARTWKEITVKTPSHYGIKRFSDESNRCVWIEVGKYRIKIFGNSGIYAGRCDKMISRKILSLPGDHAVPISILTERFVPYTVEMIEGDQKHFEEILHQCVEQYVLRRMLAGEILRTDVVLSQSDGCYMLSADMECKEMIARTVEAKWNEKDFEHD